MKRHSTKPRSVAHIFNAVVIVPIFIMATSVAEYSHPSVLPGDIAGFLQKMIGEWIGTIEQYTNGKKADTRYFHGIVKQTSPNTYKTRIEYYRLDNKTHVPVQSGVTIMSLKIDPKGTAENTITGEGDIFISPEESKPSEHKLSEVLRMTPSSSLEGKGIGNIMVGGKDPGESRNGKISDYTSTWALNNGVLSITERLKITFRILFFEKHYNILEDFTAIRGSDIMSLMKDRGTGRLPSEMEYQN